MATVHFEVAYNGDRIIEINVSTDPSQVVDISEDVVKVMLQRIPTVTCWAGALCHFRVQTLGVQCQIVGCP